MSLALAAPVAAVTSVVAGCGDDGAGDAAATPTVALTVTLDGAPVAHARVSQGGVAGASWETGGDGRVVVPVDVGVDGELVFMASVPSARIEGVAWTPGALEASIALTSLAPDNPAYLFQDPGEPTRRDTTAQCAHCHVTINEAWFASPHRSAASNPIVQDLYRGTASGLGDVGACVAAGGTWQPGSGVKGQGEPPRCALGAGVIPSLNAEPDHATAFGACADCHAPGIDGATPGGRDLRDAQGLALDYGVHCDVCHRVEAVDLAAPAGVAGRLRLHRPSEPSSSIALGRWQPLTFGPDHDVPNPRMGLVQRDHFHQATLCAGCHELAQAVLVPGAAIDRTRWPDGVLPVQTTFGEWQASAVGKAGTTCQGCHMPPAPDAWNAADLQLFADVGPGIAAGWMRPPGEVRAHSWVGPRQPASRMLELAAQLTVVKRLSDQEVGAEVTVRNVGPAHALPTGDPLRAVLLVVEARCGDTPLAPTGGDALPDWAGALAVRAAGDDWTRWPEAREGDVVRVVRRGDFVDYDGFGAFARGGFAIADKGLRQDRARGAALVTAVAADGRVTFGGPLPTGDLAFLTRGDALAGAPGFAFARVMRGDDGALMVPHFLAVDVARDNRLPPGAAWTSTHTFARAGCDAPTVSARLVHRAYPWALAAERRWATRDSLMAEATR